MRNYSSASQNSHATRNSPLATLNMNKQENHSDELTGTRVPYDVIRPHELTQYSLMELKALLEKTALELGRDWSQRLRDRIVVSVDRVETRLWHNVRAWLSPSEPQKTQAWFPLSFQSDILGAQGAIAFPAALLSNMFDRLTGGQAQPTPMGTLDSPLTDLERRLLYRIAESFSNQWEKSWEKFLTLGIKGIQPFELFNLEDSDPCAVCEFVVQWSQTSLPFYLILPYYSVDDLERRLDRSRLDWLNDFSQSTEIPSGIRNSKIHLSVILAKSTITVEELMALQPGDIITTDQSTNSPIEVYIQDKLKFLAAPGQIHGQKAVEILALAEK